MKKKLNRKLYIIPAIYLAMTLFFFHQHYSQRIQYSQVIGNIELIVQSTKESLTKPSKIKKLYIYVNGMSFKFNSSQLLSIKTEDHIIHKSNLNKFSSTEDSFILHFENNINLKFSTDPSDNKISISAELPDTVPPIIELSLPFTEDRGYTLGYTEEDNTPVISNGESNFFLTFTNKYTLDNENKKIHIDVTDNNSVTFMIQETLVGKGRTAEKWYEQNGSISDSDYDNAVSNFINSAFFG